VERAILTPAGIGEALSALHSHRLAHCASLARLGVCPPVWCLGEQLDEFSSPEVVIARCIAMDPDPHRRSARGWAWCSFAGRILGT